MSETGFVHTPSSTAVAAAPYATRPPVLTPAGPAVAAAQFDDALLLAILAVANLDRALRRLPQVSSLTKLHPDIVARTRAAVLEAVLVQHPTAVSDAVHDAGEELFLLVNQAFTEPEAAIVNDDERLRMACDAWVRKSITTFRESLAAQLQILRSPEVERWSGADHPDA